MAKFRLSRDDSSDLGFALTCLISGVISFDEFKEWIYYVIEHEDIDDIPGHFFKILDIKIKSDFTLRVREIIGFYPGFNPTDNERRAICAIGYKRFEGYNSDFTPKERALAASSRNPHIEQRFRAAFPFIEF